MGIFLSFVCSVQNFHDNEDNKLIIDLFFFITGGAATCCLFCSNDSWFKLFSDLLDKGILEGFLTCKCASLYCWCWCWCWYSILWIEFVDTELLIDKFRLIEFDDIDFEDVEVDELWRE